MESDLNNLNSFINSFKTLKIEINEQKKYINVILNRPKQLNALSEVVFSELGYFFSNLDKITNVKDVRSVILSGSGKSFSAGLDLTSNIPETIISLRNDNEKDTGRKAYVLYTLVKKLQDGLTAIEKCSLPVISAVHGFCLGGALSILVCTDIKIATKDSKFSIKEIDIGLTADLGVLQRLVKQTAKEGAIKKYSYTGETFNGEEALRIGVVDEVVENQEQLIKRSIELAEMISMKSPLVVWGTKRAINFARDNNIQSSLDMVATMNSGLLLTDDIPTSIQAFMSKTKAMYPKL